MAEREAQHDLAWPRQPAFADQRFHFRDMIAVGGLDAQVRAQIVGEAVMAVERDARRRNALRRSSSAPVIRSVAARLNRYCGTSGRAATARRKNCFAR